MTARRARTALALAAALAAPAVGAPAPASPDWSGTVTIRTLWGSPASGGVERAGACTSLVRYGPGRRADARAELDVTTVFAEAYGTVTYHQTGVRAPAALRAPEPVTGGGPPGTVRVRLADPRFLQTTVRTEDDALTGPREEQSHRGAGCLLPGVMPAVLTAALREGRVATTVRRQVRTSSGVATVTVRVDLRAAPVPG
jgi:hypothetical protein